MHAKLLFDTGATLPFISSRFVEMISAKYPIGDTYAIAVSTPSGSEVHTDRCVPTVGMKMNGKDMSACCYVMDMYDYDIILGMDWLEKHWAVVDCPRKRVTFRYPDEKEFSFQCPKHQSNRMLVSALKAESLLRKGCQGYLASMVTVSDASTFKTVADVNVIKEFPDVFPDELPGNGRILGKHFEWKARRRELKPQGKEKHCQ